MKKSTHTRRHLGRRGAVQVEYAFLLVFVMVPTAAVLLAGGRQVYTTFKVTRAAILHSYP
jgi:Flp pilus assembly pilin Flp